MTDTTVIELATRTMIIATKLSAPILVTALVVGLAISLFQSVTQVQEATLSFVPKMAAIGIAVLLAGPWMMHEMVTFTHQLFDMVPTLLRRG
jgi:flagellar biosynthesis protein FliQ